MSAHIIYLNNLAIIACCKRGRHDSAVEMLLSALHLLEWLESKFDLEFLSDRTKRRGFPTENQDTSRQALQWVKIEAPECCEDQIMVSPSSMYSYAVTLSTWQQSEPYENGSGHLIKATLMYNLAYSYHWQAAHLGISSATSAALYFYEQAGKSTQRLTGDVNKNDFEHLALAVLNNMGHLHYQLLHYQQARQFFYFLRLRLPAWMESLPLLHAKEGGETFVLNAILPVVELSLAPAA